MAILMARNPNDVAQRMAAAPMEEYADSPQATQMMAPVDPHATLTAPIGPAPVKMTNELGDALPEQAEAPPTETPKMSPLQGQREHVNKSLMANYAKDENPYGSENNHPGFFGKLLHGLNVATGGVNRRGWEERQQEGELRDIAKEESAMGLQGAQAGNLGAEQAKNEETTREMPGKNQSESDLQAATTGNLKSETHARDEALKTPSLATAYAHAVNQALSENRDPATDPIVQHLSDAITSLQKQPATKEANPQQQTFDSLIKGGMTPAQAYEKIREKPGGTVVNQGTWSLQNDTDGKPILFNSKTGETKAAPANIARKPNAEEIKRNDLAGNVNENLDTLEEILGRRPDLFGPVAGRMTKAKEYIGTSDPDVAALKTIEDNLGMALQSAHGMRSAQHVATSAESVLNGLKNSPDALRSAIKTARGSVGTFQHDVQNTNEAGKSGGGPKAGDVEGGFRFKGGDASKKENWEQVTK